MTREEWLAKHPYLQQVADFHALVEHTVKQVPIPCATVPTWHEYVTEFQAGVPVLHSPSAKIDLDCLSGSIGSVVEKLSATNLPRELIDSSRALDTELNGTSDAPQRAVNWLVDRDTFQSDNAGLLWFVGWTVLARHLSPLAVAFTAWRDEDRWLRNYCPLCGAPPAMAQLVGDDPGRIRLLSCGCCHSRWRYRRTRCPFCEEPDDQQLAALIVEGEDGLRIDYCKICNGYIKTYNGTGNEDLMLSDWSSVHLDILASGRALKRCARSLYEIPKNIGTS